MPKFGCTYMRTLVNERMDFVGEICSSLFMGNYTAAIFTTGCDCSFSIAYLISSTLELVYFWKYRLRLSHTFLVSRFHHRYIYVSKSREWLSICQIRHSILARCWSTCTSWICECCQRLKYAEVFLERSNGFESICSFEASRLQRMLTCNLI